MPSLNHMGRKRLGRARITFIAFLSLIPLWSLWPRRSRLMVITTGSQMRGRVDNDARWLPEGPLPTEAQRTPVSPGRSRVFSEWSILPSLRREGSLPNDLTGEAPLLTFTCLLLLTEQKTSIFQALGAIGKTNSIGIDCGVCIGGRITTSDEPRSSILWIAFMGDNRNVILPIEAAANDFCPGRTSGRSAGIAISRQA